MSHQLYRIYDGAGVLLYVGISKTALRRLTQHIQEKPWAHEIAEVRIQHCKNREQAKAMERDVIRRERPVHNVQHNHKPTRVTAQADELMTSASSDVLAGAAEIAAGILDALRPIRQSRADRNARASLDHLINRAHTTTTKENDR